MPEFDVVKEFPDDKTAQSSSSNAFSFLMTSFKEKEAWKEADVAENRAFRPTSTSRRKAPFYKVLQGMPIAVDAFKYGAIPGVTAYFLTHAHSDHYTNLSSSWKHGPIYCSEGTANLIIHMLSVDKKWVKPLPMDVPTLIPNTNGVSVTLIEANHCPGSCLFFYEGPQSVDAGDSTFKSKFVGSSRVFRYLHCGDFRASPKHVLHPAVKGKKIDHVYLDTTYLDPKYTFPPQPLVISACADLVKKLVDTGGTPEGSSKMLSWLAPVKGKGKDKQQLKPLIVVGTYSIGKERIVKAIAHAINSKIYCDARKAAILRCQADPELDELLTNDPKESVVHLVPLATIATDRLKIYLERFDGIYDRVIGFRPTGWTYTQAAGTDLSPSVPTILSKTSQSTFSHTDLRLSPKSTPTLQLYGVPYSEHSSFNELTCFAMSFTWFKMIATVNVGSESSRAKMAKWVAKWEAERRKRGQDSMVPHRHPEYW
ncbi:DNA repair metallo-beta-lactamase-domain-containing protein [Crepidotus variabilis]|uniref:DNA repair metallo-beta-lactamase-domain-containing protein n=1 Tax=Crepidotus variabilis TaxID=179855 RepID=A0A9P6EAF4_9AGAR|nr:DNA repair metallo-beta-lactamase-domain-containing protein [Crepidotus variabilis]